MRHAPLLFKHKAVIKIDGFLKSYFIISIFFAKSMHSDSFWTFIYMLWLKRKFCSICRIKSQ